MDQRTCANCRAPLPPQTRGRRRKYCSAKCRISYARTGAVVPVVPRTSYERVCVACGRLFVAGRRDKRCCSARCRFDLNRKPAQPRMRSQACRLCGTQFVAGRKKAYCSPACVAEGTLRTKGQSSDSHPCPCCGAATTRQFCSKRCYEKARPKRPDRIWTQTCTTCGSTFRQVRASRFCSGCKPSPPPKPTCSPVPWKDCEWCGRWFVARRSKRFCSPTCAEWQLGRKRRVVLIAYGDCAECGRLFVAHDQKQRFCSCECSRKHFHRVAKARRRAQKMAHPYEPIAPLAIFVRDGWRCGICGLQVARTKTVPHPHAPTLDHILPLARGGSHTRANVQCAHFECNWRKSDGPSNDQLRLLG